MYKHIKFYSKQSKIHLFCSRFLYLTAIAMSVKSTRYPLVAKVISGFDQVRTLGRKLGAGDILEP